MRLLVKVENLSDDDLALQIETYTRKLCEYPLQAGVKAIRRWPDTNRFWPAWTELRAEVDSIVAAMRSQALLEQQPRREWVACVDIALESDKCQCWACQMKRKLHAEGKTNA